MSLPEPHDPLTRAERSGNTRTSDHGDAADLPHGAGFEPAAVVPRPWGYALPGAMAAFLRDHGLSPMTEVPAQTPLAVEVPLMQRRVGGPGHGIVPQASVHWDARWMPGRRALPEGWCLVPTDQPRGAVAVYLCEAGSDDGIVTNGLLGEPVPGQEWPVWRVLRAPGA